jgi:hypothetical protein
MGVLAEDLLFDAADTYAAKSAGGSGWIDEAE